MCVELTFIVLKRRLGLDPLLPNFLASHTTADMIGDVNIFLTSSYDSDDEGDLAPARRRAEVELMIAEKGERRKGYGREALQMFLPFAAEKLKIPLEDFFVRIGTLNEGSIKLFEELEFVRGKVSVFDEVEMRFVGEAWAWQPSTQEMSCPLDALR
jgi:RimJ/RimL family protein N-acetyltransferase